MIKNIIEKNKNIDVNADKMDKLKELFPNCFNANGEFDISVFEEELKENTSIIKEGYGLNFLGKNYAKYVASLDTETILVPDEENNNKEENKNSENIYISGDNIDALKHLVKSYSGQIKCIYIDPPYNTGSDGFVYNDKFNLGIDKLVEVLDINEEEAKRIYNMTNAKSNSHSAWLTFMYPRLYLARQLLKKDGVIFISIDDNEQSNLKLLCDNIYGEENFINQFSWVSNITGRQISGKGAAKTFETVLAYARNIDDCENFSIDIDFAKKKMPDTYKGFEKDIREDELGKYSVGDTLYNHNRKFNEETRPTLVFSIYYNPSTNDIITDDINKHHNGYIEIKPHTNGDGIHKYHAWRWSRQKIENEKYNLIVLTMSNGDYEIHTKIRDFKSTTLKDLITNISNGDDELIKLFDGKKCFNYPKSVDLVRVLINSITTRNELILDFFSGSATTAHTVLELNAKDKGNRKHILVQLPELCDTKSEAYKNGYKTIDEIGQERIRRAAKKIKEETNADIDYGFKHYTIKDVNTNTLDKLEKFEPNYVISDGSILDEFGINAVLTTWMNEDGYGLTDKYEKLELKDYTAYKCQNTIYLLKWNISDLFIKSLIEKYEKEENFDCNRIVMFGYSFTLNEIQTLKDNLQQVKNIKGINVEVITRY